jgi:hypothetical protein
MREILTLGTGWRKVVSFKPPTRFAPEEDPRYPLDRRLGRLQNRSGLSGRKKKKKEILLPTGYRTPVI